MLDSKTLRKETKKVSLSLKKRGSDFDLDSYLKMDQKMRDLISAVEELRSSKNNINKSIASPEISENDKSDLISEVGTINKKLSGIENALVLIVGISILIVMILTSIQIISRVVGYPWPAFLELSELSSSPLGLDTVICIV